MIFPSFKNCFFFLTMFCMASELKTSSLSKSYNKHCFDPFKSFTDFIVKKKKNSKTTCIQNEEEKKNGRFLLW